MTELARSNGPVASRLDPERVRAEYPALQQEIHGHPLVYLDNAATTQKPRRVIEAVVRYYERDNANVHRGVHELSVRATEEFERARSRIRAFINASQDCEIVFTRGATEGINLVASVVSADRIREGDEILVSGMEHHSNIVPWQLVCERTGARLRVIPMSEEGELDLAAYAELLGPRTKMVGLVHVSNALGTVNPVREMIRSARDVGALVLIDGAQSVPHMSVDVQELDCDFFVFSAHKMYGPTGIGALYGRAELLESLPPYQGGGDMILSVDFDRTTYNRPPHKFEAGTPNIAGAIGFGAAVEYLTELGLDRVAEHERALLEHATETLRNMPGVRLVGTARDRASVISFVMDGVHPHDVGTVLDQEGVAVRTGHHCAQPAMKRFGVPATVRVSVGVYNTLDDVDRFASALHRVSEVFRP